MSRRKLDLTMTLSVSLNCQLSDRGKHQTLMLPLAWVSMEMSKWQRLARQFQTGLNNILFGQMIWGLG